jgi:hypothetical protein
MDRTSKYHPVPSHGSGEAVLTVCRIGREGGRLKKRTKGKVGQRPWPAVLKLEAIQRLWPEYRITREVRSSLEESSPDLKNCKKENLYRNRAHKEIRRATNWDDLRRGQRVFRLIKSRKHGVSVREIQRLLSISKDTLENLPMPSPSFGGYEPGGR